MLKRLSVGGNFFEDLAEGAGDLVGGAWDFLEDAILDPLNEHLWEPIGEKLHEFEKHNRAVFQEIGDIAGDIARESGADLIAIAAGGAPLSGGGASTRTTRPPSARNAGGGNEWVWWLAGIGGTAAVGAIVYKLTRKKSK